MIKYLLILFKFELYIIYNIPTYSIESKNIFNIRTRKPYITKKNYAISYLYIYLFSK